MANDCRGRVALFWAFLPEVSSFVFKTWHRVLLISLNWFYSIHLWWLWKAGIGFTGLNLFWNFSNPHRLKYIHKPPHVFVGWVLCVCVHLTSGVSLGSSKVKTQTHFWQANKIVNLFQIHILTLDSGLYFLLKSLPVSDCCYFIYFAIFPTVQRLLCLIWLRLNGDSKLARVWISALTLW